MTAFIARAFETVSLFLFSLPDIVVGLGSFLCMRFAIHSQL